MSIEQIPNPHGDKESIAYEDGITFWGNFCVLQSVSFRILTASFNISEIKISLKKILNTIKLFLYTGG